jgi:hypothetical protein
MDLLLLPSSFAICKLEPDAPVPAWAHGSFVSITRSSEELSIVCDEVDVPENILVEKAWRALKIKGPLDFGQTGILASFSQTLAEANVSLFAISTFDTDYLLVPEAQLNLALAALEQAGHSIHQA